MARIFFVFLLVLVFTVGAVSPARAADSIILDGDFSDWTGQPFITDPPGDNGAAGTDLLNFYFVAGEETLYFMVERTPANQKITITQFLDFNNDFDYTDDVDRKAIINYDPNNDNSVVDVEVYDGADNYLGNAAIGQDWGESRNEGGARVEWGIPFDLLGLTPGQTLNINMTISPGVGASTGDTLDTPVQWSPASVLGWPLLIVVLLAGVGVLAFLRFRMEKIAR